MAKTKSELGRMSRNKGKRFERQCREIMADITDWPYWNRTQRGDKQWGGDLSPCDKNGRIVYLNNTEGGSYYVECRARATLTKGTMMTWWQDVELMARQGEMGQWILLCKQDRGPVLAICSVDQKLGTNLKARIY